MSAAVAPGAEAAAAPAKGKKKLILILAIVGLLVAGGGGAAVFVMKKKAAEAAAAAEEEGEDGGGHAKAHKPAKKDPAAPPAFLPMEPFIVNLADKEVDRYAQIGITLEIDDAKVADQLKLYMPAIRNGILMVLAHKTSGELLERKGKEALAAEIMREVVRPIGIELDDPPADEEAEDTPKKKKKKKKAEVYNPVKHVHFSNFIIQ